MLFVLLGELCAHKATGKQRSAREAIDADVLLSGTSSPRVLVYHGCVDDLSLLDTLLDPQIRFDVFVGFSLVSLH